MQFFSKSARRNLIKSCAFVASIVVQINDVTASSMSFADCDSDTEQYGLNRISSIKNTMKNHKKHVKKLHEGCVSDTDKVGELTTKLHAILQDISKFEQVYKTYFDTWSKKKCNKDNEDVATVKTQIDDFNGMQNTFSNILSGIHTLYDGWIELLADEHAAATVFTCNNESFKQCETIKDKLKTELYTKNLDSTTAQLSEFCDRDISAKKDVIVTVKNVNEMFAGIRTMNTDVKVMKEYELYIKEEYDKLFAILLRLADKHDNDQTIPVYAQNLTRSWLLIDQHMSEINFDIITISGAPKNVIVSMWYSWSQLQEITDKAFDAVNDICNNNPYSHDYNGV